MHSLASAFGRKFLGQVHSLLAFFNPPSKPCQHDHHHHRRRRHHRCRHDDDDHDDDHHRGESSRMFGH